MSLIQTDIRCPLGSRSLLMRLLSEEDPPVKVGEQALQLHCRDCSRELRQNLPDLQRVLHVYDTGGGFLFTGLQFKDGGETRISIDEQAKIAGLITSFYPPSNSR